MCKRHESVILVNVKLECLILLVVFAPYLPHSLNDFNEFSSLRRCAEGISQQFWLKVNGTPLKL